MTQTEYADENHRKKRRKTNNIKQSQKENVLIKESETKTERCDICRQYLTEVSLYNGHPNNSVDEYVALTHEKLMLFTGDESDIHDLDTRPTHKVFTQQKQIFA